MTTTRALAVAAYLAAVAAPASADWRAVADALHAALPAVRGAAAKPADAPGTAPKWFADWKLGKVYSLDSVVVTFADGVAVRCNLAKAPGKLPRVAASCRTAVAFYRARTGRDSVPAFVSIVAASDGQEFDAEACSELTADLRHTAIVPPAVRPVVTAEAVARVEAELKRRVAGLMRPGQREGGGLAWLAAVRGAESELATMRAALDAESVAPVSEPVQAEPCAAEPVAAPVPVLAAEAAPAAPVAAPEPAPADNDDAPVPPMPGAPAPAVPTLTADAAPYEAPVGIQAPAPLVGIQPVTTPEAIGAACAHIEPMAICPAVGMPCKLDCGFRPGCGVHGVDTIEAIEAIEREPLAALCSDDDLPSVVGPVTVLCLSLPARVAIIERFGMRAIPTEARGAKHGAFRLTVEDARACAGIKSVRFIGLPRKLYTRAAAHPVVGIPNGTPVVGILADVAPRSWIHGVIAGLARPPVVLHSAPTL